MTLQQTFSRTFFWSPLSALSTVPKSNPTYFSLRHYLTLPFSIASQPILYHLFHLPSSTLYLDSIIFPPLNLTPTQPDSIHSTPQVVDLRFPGAIPSTKSEADALTSPFLFSYTQVYIPTSSTVALSTQSAFSSVIRTLFDC